jgi:hypothetical protein
MGVPPADESAGVGPPPRYPLVGLACRAAQNRLRQAKLAASLRSRRHAPSALTQPQETEVAWPVLPGNIRGALGGPMLEGSTGQDASVHKNNPKDSRDTKLIRQVLPGNIRGALG